jgi:hypothetical protein
MLDSSPWRLSSRNDLAQSETTISTHVVALDKALGGKWKALARERA